jgi:hypothetical protein
VACPARSRACEEPSPLREFDRRLFDDGMTYLDEILKGLAKTR